MSEMYDNIDKRKVVYKYWVYRNSVCVVVVGPTPPPKNGGEGQQPFLRTPDDGIPPSNRNLDPLAD